MDHKIITDYRKKTITIYQQTSPRRQLKDTMFALRSYRPDLYELDFVWWKNRKEPWMVNRLELNRILASIQKDILSYALNDFWELEKLEPGAFLHTVMTEGDHAEYQRLWKARHSLNALRYRIYQNHEIYCPDEKQDYIV